MTVEDGAGPRDQERGDDRHGGAATTRVAGASPSSASAALEPAAAEAKGPRSRPGGTYLVLGGGGVRGLAHFGVLKVLQRAGVPIDAIVGTSAGAIVGSIYACRPEAEVVAAEVLEFLRSSAFRRLGFRFDLERHRKPSMLDRLLHGLKRQLAMELLFRRPAIFKTEMLRLLAKNLVPEVLIEDARIPLFITALDLANGRELVMDSGDLRSAVVASSSVPGFFPPVERDGELLCDAGLVNNMPVDEARALGAEVVVAVSLNNQVEAVSAFATGIEVIFRNEEIGTRLINERKKQRADVVIEPDTQGRYWLDFDDPSAIVRAGEAAAERCLPAILAAVGARRGTSPAE